MQDFDKIYSEYYLRVYKFVLGLCRNESVAEEITQEAFFKALKNIGDFRGSAKLSTYLCQIAKNTFYSYIRRKDKDEKFFNDEAIVSAENIEASFVDKETAFLVHKALHKLDEPYKEVFGLRTFGELSFSQIGLIFEKTESWARVTYYRAKCRIKEDMK